MAKRGLSRYNKLPLRRLTECVLFERDSWYFLYDYLPIMYFNIVY